MSDTKVSLLDPAAVLTGAEIVPVVQAGVTVRTTVTDIGRELALWTVVTAAMTAVSGDRLLANTTSGAFTITLPATPATGASVEIVDAAGTFATNALTVGRNGATIMALSEDMTVNTAGASFRLAYSGSTWRLA